MPIRSYIEARAALLAILADTTCLPARQAKARRQLDALDHDAGASIGGK